MINPSSDVEEGIDVTMTCSSHGHPEPDVRWYKKSENSPLIESRSSAELQFLPAKLHDHGEYICFAFNGVEPNTSKSVYLTVDGE